MNIDELRVKIKRAERKRLAFHTKAMLNEHEKGLYCHYMSLANYFEGMCDAYVDVLRSTSNDDK